MNRLDTIPRAEFERVFGPRLLKDQGPDALHWTGERYSNVAAEWAWHGWWTARCNPEHGAIDRDFLARLYIAVEMLAKHGEGDLANLVHLLVTKVIASHPGDVFYLPGTTSKAFEIIDAAIGNAFAEASTPRAVTISLEDARTIKDGLVTARRVCPGDGKLYEVPRGDDAANGNDGPEAA